MKAALLSLTTAMILWSGVVSAQDACMGLAQAFAREIERAANYRESESLRIENLCSARYDRSDRQRAAQIEASYNLFSGSAGASDRAIRETQERHCEGRYGSDRSKLFVSREIDRVSDAGAQVVRDCIAARGFRLEALRPQDTALTAVFRYSGTGETTIDGIIVNPPDVAKCEVLYGGKMIDNLDNMPGQKIRSGDSITMNCRRLEVTPNDGKRRQYKGGIIGIATTTDTAQFPLIRYSEPSIADINAVQDALRRAQDQLSEEELLRRRAEAQVARLQAMLRPGACIKPDGSIGAVRLFLAIFNPNGQSHGYGEDEIRGPGERFISGFTVGNIQSNTSSYRQKRWGSLWRCV